MCIYVILILPIYADLHVDVVILSLVLDLFIFGGDEVFFD